MSTYTLARFRDILTRLDQQSADHAPHWGQDRDENTLSAELDDGLVVSLYRRSADGSPELIGAVLHQDAELEATLEAEQGDKDWDLLRRLYESAAAADDRDGPEIGLGEAAPVDRSPHRFNPMDRPEPPPDELTDGDSPLDAIDGN